LQHREREEGGPIAGTPEGRSHERVADPSATPVKKLAPGPGRPASKVAASQRARLQRAMFELVAEKGYEQVTVRELVSTAKVSSRAFYKHFRGVHDCFEATVAVAGRLIQETGQHAVPQPWIEVLANYALDPRSVPTSSLAEFESSLSSGASRKAEGASAPTGDRPLCPGESARLGLGLATAP
jgi:AcrR family transcriptional regulator